MFAKYFHAFFPKLVQLIAHDERKALLCKNINLQRCDTRLVPFRDRVLSIYLERDPARKQNVYRKTSIYQWHRRFIVTNQLLRIKKNEIAIQLFITFQQTSLKILLLNYQMEIYIKKLKTFYH